MYTIIDLKKLFVIFNHKYFEGKLPSVDITYCKAKSYVGIFYPIKNKNNRYTIKITKYYNLPDDVTKSVLIHEMIHLWQCINGYSDIHGKSFKQKMNEINKIGEHKISISEPATVKYGVDDNYIKTSFVLIWTASSYNKRVICKINNKVKLKETFNKFNNCTSYHDIKCFSVKNSITESLRNSVKRTNLYFLADDFYDQIMKDKNTKEIFL